MNTSLNTRVPLSGLEKLMLAGLVGIAIGTWGVEVSHQGQTEAIALVFVALPLAVAGLAVARVGRMPAVAAVVAAVYLAGAVQTPGELSRLAHPAASGPFAILVIELLSCVLVLVAGIATTIQHRRAHADGVGRGS